jgi:tetratricopeptide (TPR) repeat protein
VLKKVPPDSEAGQAINERINEAKTLAAVSNKQGDHVERKSSFCNHRNPLGFIVGFMFASSMSQKAGNASRRGCSQGLPADHPPVGAQNAPNPQAMREQVTASLEKARNEPKNFDAQIKAAQLYYQIQRYDQAIEYLLKANQLKPTDYQTVVLLGMVNLDAGHYDRLRSGIARR